MKRIWGAAGVMALAMGVCALGLRCTRTRVLVNTTPSVPRGLYLGHPEAGVQEVGARVYLTPPDRAIELGCVTGRTVLIKDILADGGARVCRRPGAHVVGGVSYVSSPMTSQGEAMPYLLEPGACLTVEKEHVWVGSPHPRACDSRVFGQVPVSHIRGRAKPLWIEEVKR